MALRLLAGGFSVFLAAFLVACGGSEDPSSRTSLPPNSSNFASPALLLTAGQASKVIALSDCKRNGAVPINLASLTIFSNGDVVFAGSESSTNPQAIVRINYEEMTIRYVYLYREVYSFQDYVSSYFRAYTADSRIIEFLTNSNQLVGNQPLVVHASTGDQYSCTKTAEIWDGKFAVSPSPERLTTEILKGAAEPITTLRRLGEQGSVRTGSILSWDTGRFNFFNRFASFDLHDATFKTGSEPALDSHTAFNWNDVSGDKQFIDRSYGEGFVNGLKRVDLSVGGVGFKLYRYVNNTTELEIEGYGQ